jgi:hypothetical protein
VASGGNVTVIETATRKAAATLRATTGVRGLAFSPDGKLLAAGGYAQVDGGPVTHLVKIKLWRLTKPK